MKPPFHSLPGNDVAGITSEVMHKIEQGTVPMESRRRILLGRSVIIAVYAILVALVLFLGSLAFFDIHESGASQLPAFGAIGFWSFLFSIPWRIIILLLLGVAVLELIARRKFYTYRRPLLLTLLAAIVLMSLLSWAASRTPLHRQLWDRAERGRLPFVGMFYHDRWMPRMLHHAVVGTIVAVTPDGFDLDSYGVSSQLPIHVLLSAEAQRMGLPTLAPGQTVIVVGIREGNTITARRVRPIDHRQFHAPPMRSMMGSPYVPMMR